jgi:hypothetical protein
LLVGVDLCVAQGLFVGTTGVLLFGWARLAWRQGERAGPFGVAMTRAIDRLLTGLETIFAAELCASYAPRASAAFSRAALLTLCGVMLLGALLAASRRRAP